MQVALHVAGEVILFTWVEWLKEQEHLWVPAAEPIPVAAPPADSDAELAAAMQQVGSATALIQ